MSILTGHGGDRRWIAGGLLAIALVASACVIGREAPSRSTESTPSGPIPSAVPSSAGGPACDVTHSPVPGADRWWEDRVFYEVFVRSFADGDGDGIGDLRGLTERLDYLNDGDPTTHDDLGVTGVWLMPVAESPSYHGYDVTDYRTIEPDYGTNEDFRRFVAAAHDRGIRVLVDFVVNHTSVEHPWFVDARIPGSTHDDWYVWRPDPPGWGGPSGQAVWHSAGDRVYYGLFWEGMPDLNLLNPDVTAELEDVGRFWLEEMGVDGFRLDAAQHLVEEDAHQVDTGATHAWLAGFRGALHDARPDALVLGEVFNTRLVTASYVDRGSLDLVFDFDLAGTIRNAARLGDAGSLLVSLRELDERYPAGGYATFLSNHDQNRVMSELRGDTDAARTAGAVLLTAPGVPFLYYGEEVGLQGRKPDPEIRTPLPWSAEGPGRGFTSGTPWEPFAPGADAATIATQSADPASLLSGYRTLVRARAGSRALAGGRFVPATASSPSVAAWLRTTPGEMVLVVHNLGDAEARGVSISLPAGSLCGAPSVEGITTVPTIGGDIQGAEPPIVQPDGGVAGYVPVAVIPARSSWVIRLSP